MIIDKKLLEKEIQEYKNEIFQLKKNKRKIEMLSNKRYHDNECSKKEISLSILENKLKQLKDD